MIDKRYCGYKLICDRCDEEVEEVFDNFDEAVNYKKLNKWSSIKIKDRRGNDCWDDICSDCLLTM